MESKTYQIRYNTQSTDDSNRWRLIDDGKEILVENKINRLVLFDINIEHKGQEFSSDYIKKTIGFRTI